MSQVYERLMEIDDIDIEITDVDEQILKMLDEGRCTPRYIANEIDKSRPYVTNRLKRLVEHGLVTRVDRGLYEEGAADDS